MKDTLLKQHIVETVNQLNEKMSSYKELDGARVKYSTITKSGMVNVYFDNGLILEFENNGNASILTK